MFQTTTQKITTFHGLGPETVQLNRHSKLGIPETSAKNARPDQWISEAERNPGVLYRFHGINTIS